MKSEGLKEKQLLIFHVSAHVTKGQDFLLFRFTLSKSQQRLINSTPQSFHQASPATHTSFTESAPHIKTHPNKTFLSPQIIGDWTVQELKPSGASLNRWFIYHQQGLTDTPSCTDPPCGLTLSFEVTESGNLFVLEIQLGLKPFDHQLKQKSCQITNNYQIIGRQMFSIM